MEPEHDPRSRVMRAERLTWLQEETPEGRPARRRAEDKNASDESTVLEYSFTVSLSGFVPAGD